KRTEGGHAAEAQAGRKLERARGAESQLRAELDKTQARIHELAPAPVPAAPAATGELQPLREQLEAAKSELERQVSAAEKHAREAKKHEQELRDEIKKQKGRAETNNRVYLVTKGELEVLKERLAPAAGELWHAGNPLAPPPAKERPRADA